MAQPFTARLCWSRLLALPPDVLHAIVRLLSRDALRRVQRRARELVNGLVAGARISCHDVIDKLALHRSFPNLAELRIAPAYGADEQLSDASFAEFAASALKQLASLTSLEFTGCHKLGAPALSALAGSAPQLQALWLPGNGHCCWSCDHDQQHACCALTLGCRPAARAGVIGDDALQLLPSLSLLTALNVWGTGVSWGLQHLSGLGRLRDLRLDACDSIRDEDIQALSAVSALTALSAFTLQITGASLSALASLRTLSVEYCPIAAAGLVSIAQLQQLQQLSLDNSCDGKVSRAGELAPLSQLTNLEELHVPDDWIDGPALALLDLPRLTGLQAWRITAEQYEAGRGAAILDLELHSTQDMPLGKLLPLPSLEELTIHRAYGDLSAVGKQRQLTYLGLGGLEYSGGGLAGVLPELQHLQVLHLGRVRSCLALEDMLALAQLQQLEELGIDSSDAPGEVYCLLQRCARLRKVVLQHCGSVGLPAMMALVSKPGMREVQLGGVEDAQEHEERLQRVARRLGVQLTVTHPASAVFWDEDGMYTSSEEGDESEDGLDDVEGGMEGEMVDG
jgi:hypothetical protein